VLHCSTRPMVEIANLDGDDDDDGVIVEDVSASKPRRRRPAVPPSVKKPKKPSRGAGDEEGGKFKISWLHVAFLLLFVAPTLFAVADYFFGLTPPPGQDFTHVSDEARMYKMKIKALYEDYNPEKLKEIPRLMQKYRGRERALYRAIQKKCTLRYVCVFRSRALCVDSCY
jgi:hypothetical protein